MSGASAARAEVRDGHRGLLATLRELAATVDAPGPADPAGLRATVAFLRQSVLPFARWEEGQPVRSEEVAEDTSFEHAFLAAEIDRLALAVAALERGGNEGDGLARVQRQVHRIEAVLELHVHKAEERETLFPSPPPPPPPPATGGVRPMTDEEVRDFLRRHHWGVLCTVGDGRPYAVPVSFGFDGEHVFVATGPGRKRGNLEACPAACLTVPEVESGDRWRSVVVTGAAHAVEDVRGKIHGLAAIRRQRPAVAFSAADLARVARACVFRLVPEAITGRVRA